MNLTLDDSPPAVPVAEAATRGEPLSRVPEPTALPRPELLAALPSPARITEVAPSTVDPPRPLALSGLPDLQWHQPIFASTGSEPTASARTLNPGVGTFARGVSAGSFGAGVAGPGVAPGYRSAPSPVYPAEARRRRQEGIVLLAVAVDEGGEAVAVKVTSSSGYPLLDRAAIETVRRWQFEPARTGNQAVAAIAEVPIRFSLSDAQVF